MELRNEYEAIRSRAIQGLCVPANQVTVGNVIDAVREAVTACQELADRPPRELTDAEIDAVYENLGFCGPIHVAVRAAIAAAHAKQREPQVVKFRAARRKSDGYIQMVESNYVNACWEWLDADGKAQEFEVKCV